MAKEREPGNSLGSAAAYQRALIRQAETLLSFEEHWDRLDQEDFTITGLRIRHPGVGGGEYQIIVKARINGVDCVAFHGGTTLIEALVGLVNRIANGSIKFREDRPYGG